MAVQVTLTDGTNTLAMPRPLFVRVARDIAETAQIDDNTHGSFAEVVREVAEARGTYTTLHDAIATKLDNAANAVKTMHITDGVVTEEKLSFQAREKLNSIDSESVREATAQYLAAHHPRDVYSGNGCRKNHCGNQFRSACAADRHI